MLSKYFMHAAIGTSISSLLIATSIGGYSVILEVVVKILFGILFFMFEVFLFWMWWKSWMDVHHYAKYGGEDREILSLAIQSLAYGFCGSVAIAIAVAVVVVLQKG